MNLLGLQNVNYGIVNYVKQKQTLNEDDYRYIKDKFLNKNEP